MSSSWTEEDMVKATTASNATAKNWKVQKYISGENHTDITTTGSYVCGSGGATTYDLKIAGTKVTSDNCNDLSVISGVSGTVKYDPTTKTLTLQEATINATGNGNNAINSNIDDLTININGTNNLSSSKVVIATNKSLTITGNGATLNVQSETDCGILVAKKYLMIDDCTVNAKGKYGFSGLNSLSEVLYIRNATVTAEGEECGSIVNFKSLMLEGCAITEPTGAAFDASKKAVVLGGEIVKSKVVISKNTSGIFEATDEQQLTLYPNPVCEELYLSTTAHSIHIYNMYGTEVLRATDTDRIAVSHLPAGVYTVKADSTVVKMVKR
jgi:arginine-specific protease argI polyprotein